MCTAAELKTWADFVDRCMYSGAGIGEDWWLGLGVKTIFGVFQLYSLVLVVALLLLALQLWSGYQIHRIDPNEMPHLRFGWIHDTNYAADGAARLARDYRFWALLVSLAVNLMWCLVALHYGSPQNLLEELGVESSVWQLSPVGVDLVRRYLGTWWLNEIGWCLVSIFALVIIRSDPYRYCAYHIVPPSRSK